MRAVLMQESKVSAFILKEDQLFSQDLDQQWQVSDLLGHRDRMPIAPQILTTGRSPGDMREFGILSPVLLAVVTGKTLWFFSRHFLIKFSETPDDTTFSVRRVFLRQIALGGWRYPRKASSSR